MMEIGTLAQSFTSMTRGQACLASVLLFCGASCFGTESFRAFTDDQKNFITVRGNSVAWGTGKVFHPLPTGRFTAVPDKLHFTFEDPRLVNGDVENANFDVTGGKPILKCGTRSRVYTELPAKEALALRARTHVEPSLNPAKPVLLGLLRGTQLFLYIDATIVGMGGPGSYGRPQFQLYFGPIRELKPYPTFANAGARETVVTAHDLRIVIQPGSQGSGVLIHYKDKSYALDFLRNTDDNLLGVLGEGMFRKLFSQRAPTICDSVLGE